jgi:3-hydroxyacyl-CoA dehydrogenase
VIEALDQAVDLAERQFEGLVLFNEGDNFSVGANLMLVAMAASSRAISRASARSAARFQASNQRMKYAKVPVVAAPFGMTLGGGLEMCPRGGAVQAAAETYAGLVEVGMGLVPAGGGCLNLLWRALENVPEGAAVDTYGLVTQVFKNIALAKVATSAHEAKELGFLRHTDGVTFDRARLLYDAKQRALGLARAGWHAPAPRAYKLPGESGIATLKMMVGSLIAGGPRHRARRQGGHAGRDTSSAAASTGAVAPVTEARMLELEVESLPLALRRGEDPGAHAVLPHEQQAPAQLKESTQMADVVIAAAVRSAGGRALKGALALTRPDDLAGQVIRALIAKRSAARPQGG